MGHKWFYLHLKSLSVNKIKAVYYWKLEPKYGIVQYTNLRSNKLKSFVHNNKNRK